MKAALISATILLTAAGVYAVEEPGMKEGLWSVHTQVIQHPSEQKTESAVTLCRSPAYDKQVREATKPRSKCQLVDKSSGTTAKFETECKIGGSNVKAAEVIQITGDTISHTVTDTTITPPVNGLNGMTTVADMKYVGACPAGMKPGDMMMPGGTFAHIPIP
jgi:hypothetical protein